MKHREITLKQYLLAVVITVGLASANGFAQDAEPAAQAPAAQAPAAKSEAKEELTLQEKIATYKVDAHTRQPLKIAEFIEQIQQQVSTPLNIMVSRKSRSVLIPEMELRNISVQAALNAAIVAAENEILWDFSGSAEEVIVIKRDEGYYEIVPDESVVVANVSDIFAGGVEEASLLSAIEIGLEMRDSSKKNVTIKLHKETKLLFVKGVAADINIVMQIASELGGKPWPPQGGGGGQSGGIF